MKKYLIVIILIVLIAAIFLFFRNCEAQKKPAEETTEESVEETIDQTLYKDPFIYANTDFTCQIVNNPELAEDQELMKTTLDEAYKKYGFPVDDNETMLEILNLYENNEEIINAIKTNVNECKTT